MAGKRGIGLRRKQCDQIGRYFDIWTKFFSVGRNFFQKKHRTNDLGASFFKN
jgi:hypothetical protein